MTVELEMLTLSIVLGIVQIVAASHAASLQRGYRWTASSRDEEEKVPPLRGVAGRLDRALRNFVETSSHCSLPLSSWRTCLIYTTRSPAWACRCTSGPV